LYLPFSLVDRAVGDALYGGTHFDKSAKFLDGRKSRRGARRMKNRYQIVGILSLLSLVLVVGFLFSEGRSAAAGEETVEQILWGPYWTVEPGFTSTLEMKNNRAEETLPVQVSLYFANGEEYYLDPMQLGPRQTVVIDLNHIIESLPASVAARAGKQGTAEVTFASENESALMGSISVTHPERGIAWNFRLYPTVPERGLAPVRGLFWFYDQHTDGFVAVQNASEQYLSLTPRFYLDSQVYALDPLSLAPGQGFKLELRKELRRLGLEEVSAGGIEFTYDGPPDALIAHGVLFNNHGFSTEIDFTRFDQLPEQRTWMLRTPRFALGPADPPPSASPRPPPSTPSSSSITSTPTSCPSTSPWAIATPVPRRRSSFPSRWLRGKTRSFLCPHSWGRRRTTSAGAGWS
jgi:hypothetical protein